MTRTLQIAHICLLLAVTVFLGVIGWQLDRVLRGIGTAENQLNVALAKVNQPKTGTLAEIDKTTLALKSTLVHIDIAANHEDRNLTTLDNQEAQLFSSAHGLIVASTGTANAATQTLHGASLDLATLNESIAASKSLLEASTATVGNANGAITDVRAFINAPALAAVIGNTASLTGSAAGIMADGKKVTDKATADYLDPKPWWKKLERYAGDTYDYGALFARHTP